MVATVSRSLGDGHYVAEWVTRRTILARRRSFYMFRRPAHITLVAGLIVIAMTALSDSAFAQSTLESEVRSLKEENAVVRELLRRMEAQQKQLLDQVDHLQRRLDGVTT